MILITAPHRPESWSKGSPISTWATWSYNHVPGHLIYFSEKAFREAVRRAGLNVSTWALNEGGQSFEAMLTA